MVVGTVAAVGAIAAPAVAIATGVGSVATATGAGAVATASAGGVATATTAGTVVGLTTVAIAGLAAPLVAAGPVGWIALGADDRCWDCWKAVVHDESAEPSRGRLLREILEDARVKQFHLRKAEDGRQQMIVENKWNEKFIIDLVLVEGELAAHATKF